MAEQPKRGPLRLRVSAEVGNSGKRLKPHAMVPNGIDVVKQEPAEIHRHAERQVSTGGSELLVMATAENMEEPQINLMFGVSRFHCIACLRPIKPPTFKCEAAHLVCGTCRGIHAQSCSRAGAFVACPEVDVIVRDAKLPCPYSDFGCTSLPVYFQAADHERACQWAPCYCPVVGCDAYTSPASLLDHFQAGHAWPVSEVTYGKPCELAVPPVGGVHALVGKEDRRVFLVSASALGGGGASRAVSLLCVRANGDAAPGVPQFRCKLWVESQRSAAEMALVTFSVRSKDMSGGFVAADQGSYLAVTPDLLHDVAGETPVLRVRIDKFGGAPAAAAARSPAPPASCSGRQA